MDPISLIIAAVVAGAAKGIGDEVTSDARRAYQGLRDKLLERFGHSQRAAAALEGVEAEPDVEDRRTQLAEVLAGNQAGEDPEIVALALKIVGRTPGLKINAGVTAINDGYVDNSSVQMHGPPPADADISANVHADHGTIVGSGVTLDFSPSAAEPPGP